MRKTWVQPVESNQKVVQSPCTKFVQFWRTTDLSPICLSYTRTYARVVRNFVHSFQQAITKVSNGLSPLSTVLIIEPILKLKIN